MPGRGGWLACCCAVGFLATVLHPTSGSSLERRGADVDPTGIWWVEGGSARVEIVHCGGALCGDVVWLRSPYDIRGCPLTDVENPEPRLREREVMGLAILKELRPVPGRPGSWSGGRIYDPGSGRNYRSSMRQPHPDRLEVRGYIGFELLGRTAVWHRYGATLRCTDSAARELEG